MASVIDDIGIDEASAATAVAQHPATRAATGASPTAAAPEARNASLRWRNGMDWPVILWIGFLHVGALAAPFFFTWKALAVVVLLWFVTGCIGITLGYHRLLSHGSFQTYRWMRRLIATIGCLAGEGSPTTWVATHRKHHAFSDEPDDPHSPRDGGWWSHMFWLFPQLNQADREALYSRWAPDLWKDPVIRSLDKMFLPINWGLGLLLFAVGYYFWDTYTAWSFVVYGVFVRMVYVLHATWLINSATHLWGYRNYVTTDDSRNLWWVSLLTFGEGWHNNHHAHQRMARHGHRWWEVDITYGVIRLLEKTGLAWNVVHDLPRRQKGVGV
ncbi:MAG: fatty acid desaturase [Pirellulales bacterium]|nr:fatty acid desaturase [Pirellulales bacterium]